jgi:hypothetical protein
MNKQTYKSLAVALLVLSYYFTSAQTVGYTYLKRPTSTNFTIGWTKLVGVPTYSLSVQVNGQAILTNARITGNSKLLNYTSSSNGINHITSQVKPLTGRVNALDALSRHIECPRTKITVVYIWPMLNYQSGNATNTIYNTCRNIAIQNNKGGCQINSIMLTDTYISDMMQTINVTRGTVNTSTHTISPNYTVGGQNTLNIPQYVWEEELNNIGYQQVGSYNGIALVAYDNTHTGFCDRILSISPFQLHKVFVNGSPNPQYQQDVNEADALSIGIEGNYFLAQTDCDYLASADCYLSTLAPLIANPKTSNNQWVKIIGDPSIHDLRYILQNIDAGPVNVSVLDLSYRQVLSQQYTAEQNGELTLSLPHSLDNGLYILSVENNGKKTTVPFMIAK